MGQKKASPSSMSSGSAKAEQQHCDCFATLDLLLAGKSPERGAHPPLCRSLVETQVPAQPKSNCPSPASKLDHIQREAKMGEKPLWEGTELCCSHTLGSLSINYSAEVFCLPSLLRVGAALLDALPFLFLH